MPGFDELRELADLIGAETGAMLPGDGEPEDHVIEQVAPSKGAIRRKMEQAREGHRVAEEDPERGAYHGGAPLPDMGGETVPYDQRAAAPSLYEGALMRGGVKMRAQSFDEAKAEIARENARHARALAEHARDVAEREAQTADQEARAARLKAKHSGF